MSGTSSRELNGAAAVEFAKRLRKVGVNAQTWEVEYIDDVTGERWIMDYPQSELHGGGRPVYAHAEWRAVLASPDLNTSWALTDPKLQEKDGFVSTALGLGLSMCAPTIDEPYLDAKERAEPAQASLRFGPDTTLDRRGPPRVGVCCLE